MRIGRRLFAASATLVLWAGAAVAGGLDDIVARGELVVGVYRDFPPFSERQGETLTGIDIDLGAELARRMNLKVQFFELTAGETADDDLRNGVWKGHYLARRVADVMLHLPTDRTFALRNTQAVIFAPYFRERVVVARDPEQVNSRDGVDIFAAVRVGVELDSLADLYLTQRPDGRVRANVVHYPTNAKAMAALVAGEVAAVMGSESEIVASLGAARSRFPVGPMELPGLAKPSWELGLAVKENARDLAWALGDVVTAMREDGAMAAIFARHGLPYVAPEE